MSKINKIHVLVLILVIALFYAIWHLSKNPESAEREKKTNHNRIVSTQSGSKKGQKPKPIDYDPAELADTIATIEKFDIALQDLRRLNSEEWIFGLEKIAKDATKLAKQSDFESVTAAALMIKRITDLAIGRLLSGEVAVQATYDVLSSIDYHVPTDRELIDMVGQYYHAPANGDVAAESVMEFVSRYEPDVVFPEDSQWVPGNTMYGMITEHNATLSLMTVAWAKPQLELARVTGLYLLRGGDRNLRNEELAVDLELKVGKEMEQIKPPDFAKAFGNMNPKSKDISSAIGESFQEFERSFVSSK
jgi:hypothetical protein